MHRNIEIGLAIPSTGPSAARAIEAGVNLLAIIDEIYLRENPSTPTLGKSGVRYQREIRSLGEPERWQSIQEMLKTGVGDCEDLVAWLTAQLRIQGFTARPLVIPAGKRIDGRWHMQVEVKQGKKTRILDPSRGLGM